MFLPGAKIRVLASTADGRKTRIKKDSLLYVVRGAGLSTPATNEFRNKFDGSVLVMPAKVVITRYGNETRRRAEVKPTMFVFPIIDSDGKDKAALLQKVLSELKGYGNQPVNMWSVNKHGISDKKLDYVVGYPTLEEANGMNTVNELSAWLYSIINNMLHYYANPLNATVEQRQRILKSITDIVPVLRFRIQQDTIGMFHFEYLNDIRVFIDGIHDDKNKMDSVIKWALAHKALLARRLFLHNANVYESSGKILRDLTSSMIVPKPIILQKPGWESVAQRGSTTYRKLKYSWITATNNLPVNYISTEHHRISPWVDYFKSISHGNI